MSSNLHISTVQLLTAWLLIFLSTSVSSGIAQQSAVVDSQSTTDGETAPYLLFSVFNKIYQMYLDGTSPQELRTGFGIVAVDYHYRSNRLFWLADDFSTPPALMSAPMNDSSASATTLVNRGIDHPVDLAVDWINDKVYWADRGNRVIEEYDLNTEQRRVVHTFPNDIRPASISVFPATDDEHLYVMAFVDRLNANLFRIPINGSSRTVVRERVMCPGSVTIEFKTNTVFWNDYCSSVVETVKIDGTQYSVVYDGQSVSAVGLSEGIAHYENTVYWIQSTQLFEVDISSEDKEGRVLYTAGSNIQLTGLQVVHPSKQPVRISTETEVTTETPPPEEITTLPTSTTTVSSSTTAHSTTPPSSPPTSSPVELPTTSTERDIRITTSSSTVEVTSSTPEVVTEQETTSLVTPSPTPVIQVRGTEELSEITTQQLLIYILPAVGALIIAVLVLSVLVVVYCKHQQKRKGSYTISHVQPQSPKTHHLTQVATSGGNNRMSTASEFFWQEAGAPVSPSARSSGAVSFAPGSHTSGETASTTDGGGVSPFEASSTRAVHV